jgi:hypothetical protein
MCTKNFAFLRIVGTFGDHETAAHHAHLAHGYHTHAEEHGPLLRECFLNSLTLGGVSQDSPAFLTAAHWLAFVHVKLCCDFLFCFGESWFGRFELRIATLTDAENRNALIY